MMPRFLITGVLQDSGQDTHIELEASCSEDATNAASERGIFVARVYPVPETPLGFFPSIAARIRTVFQRPYAWKYVVLCATPVLFLLFIGIMTASVSSDQSGISGSSQSLGAASDSKRKSRQPREQRSAWTRTLVPPPEGWKLLRKDRPVVEGMTCVQLTISLRMRTLKGTQYVWTADFDSRVEAGVWIRPATVDPGLRPVDRAYGSLFNVPVGASKASGTYVVPAAFEGSEYSVAFEFAPW